VAFRLPNAGSVLVADQAAPDAGDFDVLASAPALCGVQLGGATDCQVTVSTGLTLNVAAGTVRVQGWRTAVTAGTVTLGTAHATLARYDLIVVAKGTGTKSVIAGTASSAPEFPAYSPTTQLLLAAVRVAAATATIVSGNVVDKRVMVAAPPAELATWYGAVDDIIYTTGSSTASSATVTSTTGIFTSTAVDAGKVVAIANGVSSGIHFLGKISTVTSSTQAVLTAVVPATTSGVQFVFGTDSWQAIKDAQTVITGIGGGTLIYPDTKTGAYLISQVIRCQPGVYHRAGSRRVRITNRWSGGSNVHPINQSGFAPGFVHGDAIWTSGNGSGNNNPGSPAMPHYALTAVAVGATTVTGSSAGQVSSNVQVGDYVAVRSQAAATLPSGAAYSEFPFQMYYARVLAKSTDTVTLSEVSPYAIAAGGYIVRITGSAVANGTFFTGNSDFPAHGVSGQENMWMTRDCGVDGFVVDAKTPIWGGGVLGFTVRDVRPVDGAAWDSFITANALCNTVIQDCYGVDFTFTWCELKLGSGNVKVENCHGRWTSGSAVYTPVGIGESAHGVTIEHNTVILPSAFNDANKVMFDIQCSLDVKVRKNLIRCHATDIDCVVAVADTNDNALNISDGLDFSDNLIAVTGASTTGAARVFKVALGAGAFLPVRLRIVGNKITGSLRANVNQWLNIQKGNADIRDNVPPAGTTAVIGTAVTGYVPAGRTEIASLSADVTTTSTSITDVSGELMRTVEVGVYDVTVDGLYRSSLTSAGPRFGVGGSCTVGTIDGAVTMWSALATAPTVTLATAANTGYGVNPDATGVDRPVQIKVRVNVTAAGTLGPRWLESAASTGTFRRGARLQLTRVG
jgi:hypothetical protein